MSEQEHPDRTPRPWPLVIIGLAAAVAVWSGWVGLGELAGFGKIRPLPGIWDELEINSAVVLPLSVEAYGAYALRVWLGSGGYTATTVRFARVSAITSLVIGGLAQVAYHLMVAAGMTRAPWPVVVLVALVPVVVLGLASALAKLCGEQAPPITTARATRTIRARRRHQPNVASTPIEATSDPGSTPLPPADVEPDQTVAPPVTPTPSTPPPHGDAEHGGATVAPDAQPVVVQSDDATPDVVVMRPGPSKRARMTAFLDEHDGINPTTGDLVTGAELDALFDGKNQGRGVLKKWRDDRERTAETG